MNQSILLLGAQGQLGRDLQKLLPQANAWTRHDVDLTHAADLRTKLTSLQPATIINCAAYNLVDKAETDPQAAFATNTWAVRDLASIARDLGATLVQISSDYVFGLDQARQTPFTETDAPGPVSAYGTSKLSGEYFVQSRCPKHFVIRTCGLYGVWGSGGKGGNFVETMLRLAKQGTVPKIVADQHCTPTSTIDLAQGIVNLIATEAYGLYHLVNDGSCTWCEFANEIFRLEALGIQGIPITSAEFNAPARRPGYSVLDTTKYRQVTKHQLRHWKEALADYIQLRKAKPSA